MIFVMHFLKISFCYAGAFGFSGSYSSVPMDVKEFYNRRRNDLERIVAFPYLKLCQIGTTVGNESEDV